MEDEELAIIRLHKETKIRKIKDDTLVSPYIQQLKLNIDQIEKGGYEHFMLKEIFEQPQILKNLLENRINKKTKDINFLELKGLNNILKKTKKLSS